MATKKKVQEFENDFLIVEATAKSKHLKQKKEYEMSNLQAKLLEKKGSVIIKRGV